MRFPLLILLAAVATARSSEPGATLRAFLQADLIPREQPMAEVQAYLEPLIPKPPVAGSARAWRREAGRLRRELLERVVLRGEARGWAEAPLRVEWLEFIEGGPGYRIQKLRYEAVPGVWIPALLYWPDRLERRMPVALHVNGHDGAGKAAGYKQIRCINLAKRGMLVLNPEWFGMGQLRDPGFHHGRMNQLDLCGTSGLAPFYLALRRGLDLLLRLPEADPDRVAVSGLSGGGWQTIFISALDERVTLANPVAGYSSFHTRVRVLRDLGDSEQTPCDMATVADYIHLTAMRAPRPTLLTYNAKDECCFRSEDALGPLMKGAFPVFEKLGRPDHLAFHVNHVPGTHNYEQENREAYYRMLALHFKLPGGAREIPCEAEVKPPEALEVELPEDQKTFHSLALELSRRGSARRPSAGDRYRLEAQVAWREHPVHAELVEARPVEGHAGRSWLLKLGPWTLPLLEVAPAGAGEVVLLFSEQGRPALASAALTELQQGRAVAVIDPLFWGENQIHSHAYLFGLLTAAVGERPLGLQAGQVASVAGWLQGRFPQVRLRTVGPRSGVTAWVAAAVRPGRFAGVETGGGFQSLREVITRNWIYEQAPEMFCFGMLPDFDLPRLQQLYLAHRPNRPL